MNNIDLMLLQGYDFLPAYSILENWLLQYRRDTKRRTPSEQSVPEHAATEQPAIK